MPLRIGLIRISAVLMAINHEDEVQSAELTIDV